MKTYIDILKDILNNGKPKSSGRNVVDTISLFGVTYKHDLDDGFPLLTTKYVSFKNIVEELRWYLSGSQSIKGFDLKFWEPWADSLGRVPSAYGFFWRRWSTYYGFAQNVDDYIDQIDMVIKLLKSNPYSRRAVVTAWHPENAWESDLPPCHDFFVFNYDGERLNMHLTQRSGDVPIGIPYNLAIYSLLLMIIANIIGLKPGVFSHTIVDAHIYGNQIEQAKEQIARETYPLPKVIINNTLDINNIQHSDFTLIDYKHHPAIKYAVEV